MWNEQTIANLLKLHQAGHSWGKIAKLMGITKNAAYGAYVRYKETSVIPEDTSLVHFYRAAESSRGNLATYRKLTKALDKQNRTADDMLLAMEYIAGQINNKYKPKTSSISDKKEHDKRNMTVELLIGDIQYGQQSRKANSAVFRARLREVARATIVKLEQYNTLGYNVEKLIVALLGDIIESAHMHGHDSAISVEFNTSEQMRYAMESLWWDLLHPLMSLGIPMHIPAIPGNHDRVESEMPTFEPGKSSLSWPIYHGLKMLSEAAGFKHVTWDIVDGVYSHLEIYGHGVVYEHGYKLSPNEKALLDRMLYRSKQIGKPMTYFRMGDQHRCIRFGLDEMVVNPAICGDNWYSEGKGFAANSGQLLFSYVERNDNKLPLFESFLIQLEFINKETINA